MKKKNQNAFSSSQSLPKNVNIETNFPECFAEYLEFLRYFKSFIYLFIYASFYVVRKFRCLQEIVRGFPQLLAENKFLLMSELLSAIISFQINKLLNM